MIDREHLEQAGLHALDLLDDAERAAFDRELRLNPSLRAAVREARDMAAGVALSGPQKNPPHCQLAAIRRRINRSSATQRLISLVPPAIAQPAGRFRVHPAWAAAAVFAVLASWFAVTTHRQTVALRLLQDRAVRSGGGGNPRAGTADAAPGSAATRPGQEAGTAPADESPDGARPPGGWLADKAHRPQDLRMVQDTDQLKAELRKLRAATENRLNPPAGVADIRILEMHPPDAPLDPNDPKKSLLSTKVADALAAGISGDKPKTASTATDPKTPTPPKDPAPAVSPPAAPETKSPVTPEPAPKPEPLHLKGNGASASHDITIDQGMVNLNALQLHPDTQVLHTNFPADGDLAKYGLTRIDANNVWDGQGWVWHRLGSGQYVGQKTPPGWQAPDPDDPQPVTAPPVRPAPPEPAVEPVVTPVATTPAPASTPPPAPLPPAPMAGEPVGPAVEERVEPPYALPIIDQNGQGTFIVEHLPAPPAGLVYQLWMVDPQFQKPVAIGTLPPLSTGSDHFSFDMGASGFLPSSYLLTLEKPGHTGPPAGKVILKGP